jgi:hypothetical protein
MLRKIIRGELHASNPKNEQSNWHWQEVLHGLSFNSHLTSVINHDREWFGSDSKGVKWDENSGAAFNSSSPAWNERSDFINFINALKELMETEEAVTLGLEGSFEIVMDTEKLPLIFRVKIEDNKVSYQEASHIIWAESVTA